MIDVFETLVSSIDPLEDKDYLYFAKVIRLIMLIFLLNFAINSND